MFCTFFQLSLFGKITDNARLPKNLSFEKSFSLHHLAAGAITLFALVGDLFNLYVEHKIAPPQSSRVNLFLQILLLLYPKVQFIHFALPFC